MRDADGFDEFYRGTSPRLLRYGYALCGDLTEAQEMVQEAYTPAWQRWPKLATHPNPERLTVSRMASDRWRRLVRSGPPGVAGPPGEDTWSSSNCCVAYRTGTAGPRAALPVRPSDRRDRAGEQRFGQHREVVAAS